MVNEQEKREEFKKVISLLSSAYKNFELATPEDFNAWYFLLKDIPITDLKYAVIKLISESEYPPTIATIRRQAVSVSNPNIRAISATEAWEEVETAIMRYGTYREQEALDSLSPLARAVTVRFGYKYLCLEPLNNRMATRAQFIKAYEAQAEKDSITVGIHLAVKNQIDKRLNEDSTNKMAVVSDKKAKENKDKLNQLIVETFSKN